MILGIDVGNTNIVAALLNADGIQKEFRCNTEKGENAVYYKKYLDSLLEKQAVSGVVISSVVPELNAVLQQACIERTGLQPIFVSADLKTGLVIRYDNPKQLGADLLTAAVGAVKQYGGPVIVVDIGTATTFSVINEKKEYLGGMIAPGPYTSMKALASMTSQLPEIELTVPEKIVGTNTADCIRIGVVTAQAAMLDGMILRVQESLGVAAPVIATGGFAEMIAPMCRCKIICDNDLIFRGLYELYQMNGIFYG